jgi:hypothetical protein
VSALFTVFNPLYSVHTLTLPVALIFTLSLSLLVWHWKNKTRQINIPLISFIFGGIWAWHIAWKFMLVTQDPYTFLLLALLSVLFIGSLAFASDIKAFTIHSLPTFLVCLWFCPPEYSRCR